MAEKRGKIIVLAEHETDVVVITPRTLDRAHGLLGRQLLVSENIAGQLGMGDLFEAVTPCFATRPASTPVSTARCESRLAERDLLGPAWCTLDAGHPDPHREGPLYWPDVAAENPEWARPIWGGAQS